MKNSLTAHFRTTSHRTIRALPEVGNADFGLFVRNSDTTEAKKLLMGPLGKCLLRSWKRCLYGALAANSSYMREIGKNCSPIYPLAQAFSSSQFPHSPAFLNSLVSAPFPALST